MKKKILFLPILLALLSFPLFVLATIDTNLKYGEKGEEVGKLQKFLIDYGLLKSEVTGYFGRLTLKAVKDYQSNFQLPVTGFVGPLTRGKMNSENGVFPNSKYYPVYLPYISKTVISLPIILPNITIDPASYKPVIGSGFKNEYLSLANRLYIVQFKNNSSTFQSINAKPITAFSENTYIVNLNDDQLKQLVSDTNINFMEDYHPHYKLDPELVNAFYKLTITPTTTLRIVFSRQSKIEDINQAVNIVPASVVSKNLEEHSVLINGLSDRQQLFTLANNPLITEIYLMK